MRCRRGALLCPKRGELRIVLTFFTFSAAFGGSSVSGGTLLMGRVACNRTWSHRSYS